MHLREFSYWNFNILHVIEENLYQRLSYVIKILSKQDEYIYVAVAQCHPTLRHSIDISEVHGSKYSNKIESALRTGHIEGALRSVDAVSNF